MHGHTGHRIRVPVEEAKVLVADTKGRWQYVTPRRTAVCSELTKYRSAVDSWLLDPGMSPLPWSHAKRGLCNLTGQFKPTKLFEFLYIWTSLIARAFSTVPSMAGHLITFQLWFSKLGYQLALSWESVSQLIVHAINLIGTGSGTFANPGFEAERAVRALASNSTFNGPNLGCEMFSQYSFSHYLSSGGDAYGQVQGTAINCDCDDTYRSLAFRQQFQLAV